MNHDLFSQFAATWNYFSVRALPGSLFRTEYTDDNPPPLIRVLTPLVGFVMGLAVAVPVFLISLFGRVPAAVAGGLLAPLALEFLTAHTGLDALTRYIEARRSGIPQDEALPGNTDAPEISNLTKIVLFLLRAALFFVLFRFGAGFWIVIALTGGYLVRAEMATVRTSSGIEFFPTENRFRSMHWAVGFCAMFAASLFFTWNPLPLLCAFGLSWLTGSYAAHLCAESPDGCALNAMCVFGYASELALLLLGAFIYV